MDISDWRDKIDNVDRELVELLNHRARIVLEIARLKKEQGLAIYEPQREEEIFRNIAAANGGPLDYGALRRVFERIIDEGRSIQRPVMDPDGTENQPQAEAGGTASLPKAEAGKTRNPPKDD